MPYQRMHGGAVEGRAADGLRGERLRLPVELLVPPSDQARPALCARVHNIIFTTRHRCEVLGTGTPMVANATAQRAIALQGIDEPSYGWQCAMQEDILFLRLLSGPP